MAVRSLTLFLLIAGLLMSGWVVPRIARVAPATGVDMKQAKPNIPPGVPEDSQPTGMRDHCHLPNATHQLTALLPLSEKKLALTAASSPTFFVYVPPRQPTVKEGEFRLFDRQGKMLLVRKLNLPNQSGILGLNLPASVFSLKLKQLYRWEFSLICQASDRTKDTTVGAFIQRVELGSDLIRMLQSASPQAKIDLYAQEGIWHDLLGFLVRLHLQQPSNPTFRKNWLAYLKQANLAHLTEEAILPTITIQLN